MISIDQALNNIRAQTCRILLAIGGDAQLFGYIRSFTVVAMSIHAIQPS